ncbi:polymorphic toxin type 15 domain-containing protein [Neolewinella lacunae]|uniref:Uncharacterized protein n=1 Tax=Neolewinella lacunae TaxID=1517758 RepID=A0A923PL80_9BACT|nr:polymorphic toxin type 15 domain-containing protein [Neolewinella lacunae]MBC6993258.1 hypothetical protein [Neolewinella lacunae]MDN3635695.1 polymorphic toxin type 15 domain-containing protein [Neolewinella lacunae]
MIEARAQRPRPAPRKAESLLPLVGGAGQALLPTPLLAPAAAPKTDADQLAETALLAPADLAANAPRAIEMAPEAPEAPSPEDPAEAGAEAELAVEESPRMEVELIIPPPSPEIEARSSQGARSASGGMGGAGSANQALPPADENAQTARTNVQEPDAETLARADAALTATLREVPAPSPEIEQLCDDIQDAIENRRPVDEDSLRRANPAAEAQAVGDNLNSDIQGSADNVSGTYDAVNDPTSGTPEQVSAPLPEPATSVATPPVNAAGASPPASDPEDLDLGPDLAATSNSVEEAGMTTEPAELVEDEPFASAREGLSELEATAAIAPAEVMRQEQEAIASSQASMRALQVQALQALENSRGNTIQDTLGGQLAMARTEEEKRVAASAAADTIFTRAQDAVNALIDPMVSTAMERWTAGKNRIVGEFDRELQRAKDLVDERHEGIGGAIVSIWDDVTGLPSSITRIYDRAEATFGREICALIREISTYVNGIVIACEELIDNADRDIQNLFDSLGPELATWAAQQRGGFQERLDGLRNRVHETQTNFTNDLVSQAGDAVQEARERIDALREAAKGLIQKVADAVNAFLEDPVRAIINGLLSLVGIAPGAFWALVAQIEQVASDIADDPRNFANNLMAAVGQGFSQFFDNFFTHLLSGFLTWMFSAMGAVGVQLPPDMSVGSIITFFLQLMGITWPNIRQILARHIGEENVALLEQAYELLSILITQGPAGIYEMIRERLDPAMILQSIIDAAVSYLVERIVAMATARLLMLFNPVGAIVQAIEAIFRVLQWIFQNAARIFSLVQTIVSGVADLIAGNIGGMAARVEQALAGLLVPVIDFIASYLGLGDLPERVADVVKGFQQMVLGAIDQAIGFLVERARGLLANLGLGAGAGAEDGDNELGDDEVGKNKTFSGGGEGHRMWIGVGGSTTVMVASGTPEPLGTKVRRWIGEVGDLPAAEAAEARGLLQRVSAQEGILLTEAEQAKLAIAQADGPAADPALIATAQTEDAEVERKQDELAPEVGRLFDIFEGGVPFQAFNRQGNLGTARLPFTVEERSGDLKVEMGGSSLTGKLNAMAYGPTAQAHHQHGNQLIQSVLEATDPAVRFIERVSVRNGRLQSPLLQEVQSNANTIESQLSTLGPTKAHSLAHLSAPPPHNIQRQEIAFTPDAAVPLNNAAMLTEYDRQLDLQTQGINQLLVDQWVLNRNAYSVDESRFAALDSEQRRVLLLELNRRATAANNVSRANVTKYQRALDALAEIEADPDNADPSAFVRVEAVSGRIGNETQWKRVHITQRPGLLAQVRAEMELQYPGWTQITAQYNILHNADQVAGGFGTIPAVALQAEPGPDGDLATWRAYLQHLAQYIGSADVNQAIGRSWRTRYESLHTGITTAYPPEGWGIWKMNVSLRRS